jgi:predicted nuclease of predicted toxin-antitoxin system
MRFKVDENLPAELAEDLRVAGFDAETVPGEGLAGIEDLKLIETTLAEQRVLLTLDKGIANVLSYPAGTHAGVVLFRPGSVGRTRVSEFVRSRLPKVLELEIMDRVTVVTETRIRIR